jgi:hypothetical protein
MSWPSNEMLPLDGTSNPSIRRMSVDLPAARAADERDELARLDRQRQVVDDPGTVRGVTELAVRRFSMAPVSCPGNAFVRSTSGLQSRIGLKRSYTGTMRSMLSEASPSDCIADMNRP